MINNMQGGQNKMLIYFFFSSKSILIKVALELLGETAEKIDWSAWSLTFISKKKFLFGRQLGFP
jgi:hypothetical protein